MHPGGVQIVTREAAHLAVRRLRIGYARRRPASQAVLAPRSGAPNAVALQSSRLRVRTGVTLTLPPAPSQRPGCDSPVFYRVGSGD